MGDGMMAESITITGHGGDEIEAYLARPTDPGPHPGVVVIHHMPGYDRGTKEIARTFAVYGYGAVVPNLFHRYAPGARPGDAAAAARAAGGAPDDQAMGDVGGALAYLRSQEWCSGKVGVIGYCSGGRQTYIAACTLDFDAAVDCYGGGVVMPPGTAADGKRVNPIELTKDLRCPLLGLFGKEDRNPSPEHVARMEEELSKHNKTFEFHSYEGAGHAFFSVDRPSYNLEAARDGWKQIWNWLGHYLKGEDKADA